MRFFVPLFEERLADAGRIWRMVREKLAHLGLTTTPRRIRALWRCSGEINSLLEVGALFGSWGDSVLFILEAQNRWAYCVVTPSKGALEGVP